MPFKPFIPPLKRKDLPNNVSQQVPDDSSVPHPSKRPRLSVGEHEIETDKAKPVVLDLTLSDARIVKKDSIARRPLLKVKNMPGEIETLAVGNGNASNDIEAYYNVLWRKFTAKKHKTWDGDGILVIQGGYGYLRDVSGREMGRIVINKLLECGTSLTIGGKDVEVESAISKKDYLSGKEFLNNARKPSSSTPSRPRTASSGATQISEAKNELSSSEGLLDSCMKPKTMKHEVGPPKLSVKHLNAAASRGGVIGTAFKNPLKETSTATLQSVVKPIPRHDPNAPGALVMKRPKTAPKGQTIVDVVVDPFLTKHLREHQREGVKFLYECVMGLRDYNGEGAILADEMGLGKTLQTITLLWTLLKQNFIYEAAPVVKKALIVCPVTLINNWRKEFRKWLGNERIGVFVFDDKRKKLTDFTMGKAYNVMIIGYEKLRTVQEGLLKGHGIDIVIADEGHRLKTVQNKSGQAIQALNTAKRIILSGTPIQNDLSEFFAAVDLVNPGILGTYKNFMKEFEGPIVRSQQPEATIRDIEKGETRGEELRELTSMFILRRTADILSRYLPPKTEYVILCNPTSVQASIYRHVLGSPIFQTALGNTEGAFSLLTILKKLCNSPSLLNAKTDDEPQNSTVATLLSTLSPSLRRQFSPSSSGKIRVLDQLLHNLRTSTSEKIVIVSNYTSTLNLLGVLLTSLSLPFLRLDGSTPSSKRQSLVDDFNRAPASTCFAFLLSAKAGGTGLNLTGASRLVLYDVDWNPATDLQAMARIHRDGQKRHCYIYRIMLKGALEEKIWQRQVTKIGLADSVMESKSSNMAQFSREELKDLFRLYEDKSCQTHELLNCKCGGRGRPPPTPVPISLLGEDDEDNEVIDPTETTPEKSRSISPFWKEEELSDSEDIDLPDIPTLMKASEVNIEEQEDQIRRGQHALHRRNGQKAANTKMAKQSSATLSSRKRKARKDEDEDEMGSSEQSKIQRFLAEYAHIDPAAFRSNGRDNGDDDIKNHIDDPILQALLDDEDHGIGFLFQKTAFPTSGPETSESGDKEV
ncbi:dsDNA-dependent ATPase (Rad54b), putative [Talaromyces stipitatus ATCC 10500]|uniref:DsDNA-dependent ATPase (Rad54b), putative n=1 Tax=Talaromyces stipitatus (strain ATCC 10500 / CBS 375.48 / QM 6759 / NRRL 1006) TaxID=441959 RepID=B8M2T0_TALSN|nr:dsDNA-dependent ATPase (Rad54b), putative [Talaromyces stipitatus ATCC 10500]EED22185.1 dsDNA-dependent ATPase (Rad54b), putative [Talaromyces stipitatus ATCC 10500]